MDRAASVLRAKVVTMVPPPVPPPFLPAGAVAGGASAEPGANGGTMPNGRSPGGLLLIVWGAGLAIVVGYMVKGWLQVRRAGGGFEAVDDGSLREAMREAMHAMGVVRTVTLLAGRAGAVPMTYGIVHPVIMLPRDAIAWESERVRLVLLHELAHVRRNDALAQLIASVARAVFWFNPLVWIASRELRRTAECSADDMVVSVGVKASTYVDTLLELVRGWRSEPALAAGVVTMARRGEFEGRMLALLDERKRRRPLGSAAAAALAGSAVAASVALGAAQIGPRRAGAAAGPAASTPQSAARDARTPARSLLAIAAHARGDIARLELLERVVASGPLSGDEVDDYLGLVAQTQQPIPRGSALRALVGAAALDPVRVDRAIELTTGITSQVERSISLATIARTQALGPEQKARFYAAAESLDGPALSSALDALR
jgi:beta-lactamase regulating signal transducer with metallopeptidase domain